MDTIVDYVFPYLDSSDIEWYEEYKQNAIKNNISISENNLRIQSYENLQYLLRCIAENIPWIRTIHMIVERPSQVPKWLDTSKVHIVYHSDIIPKEYLPTYNSQTIEMFLHNINGLSEYFIYGNDDVFPISYCSFNDFFDPIKITLKKIKSPKVNTWEMTLKHNSELIGLDDIYRTNHSLSPMLKSNIIEVFSKYESEILNSCTMFRDYEKNYNQYLFLCYYKMSHEIQKGHSSKCYTIPNKLNKVKASIINPHYKVICLNDTEEESNSKLDYMHEINQVFFERFPYKCKYEIGYDGGLEQDAINSEGTKQKVQEKKVNGFNIIIKRIWRDIKGKMAGCF